MGRSTFYIVLFQSCFKFADSLSESFGSFPGGTHTA